METASTENENSSDKRKKIQTLKGHNDLITRLDWSPSGTFLVSGSNDKTIKVWDVEVGRARETFPSPFNVVTNLAWSPDSKLIATSSIYESVHLMTSGTGKFEGKLTEHTGWVSSITWSPDSQFIATTCADEHIRIWLANRCYLSKTLKGHQNLIRCVTWSPDGLTIASSSSSGNIRLWNSKSFEETGLLKGHSDSTSCLAWSPDSKTLVSASTDNTIRLWNMKDKKCFKILKDQENNISCLDFSFDGSIFATMNEKGTVVLYRTDIWELLETFDEPYAGRLRSGLAFHPNKAQLATISGKNGTIHVWDLEAYASGSSPATETGVSNESYVTTKILLVGDSKINRSVKGSVARRPLKPETAKNVSTSSTLARLKVKFKDGRIETHEMVLRDLTNHENSKGIYRLHMKDVSTAFILYDASDDSYNFDEVMFWNEELRQASLTGKSEIKIFLIVLHPNPKAVKTQKIEALVNESSFEGYFVVFDKAWKDIEGFTSKIHNAIDWKSIDRVTFPELITEVKEFLIKQKKAGRLLTNIGDLFDSFIMTNKVFAEKQEIRPEFDTCIRYFDSLDIIYKFNFGGLVLFKPELLNTYVCSMMKKAGLDPDGLGNLQEEDARAGRFNIPVEKRLNDKEKEKLLLLATIEELLFSKTVIQDTTDKGQRLVFPAQIDYETPDYKDPGGKELALKFKGPVQDVMTLLSVNVVHSNLFTKKAIWKNATTFVAIAGNEICGIFLRTTAYDSGEIALFFGTNTTPEIRQKFDTLIQKHLKSLAVDGSVTNQQVIACSECGEVVSERVVKRRRDLGHTSINCPLCDTPIQISDKSKTGNEEAPQGNSAGTARVQPALNYERKTASISNLGVLRSLDNLRPGMSGSVQRPQSVSMEEMQPLHEEEVQSYNSKSFGHAGMRKQTLRSWAGSAKCTLAIAFTDILGSSVLGNKLGNDTYNKIRQAHFIQARKLLKKYDGFEIKTIGDSVMAAFRTATDILDFALDFYKDTGDDRIKIRVGMHVGPVTIEQNDVFGITVNYTARVESMAKGAEVWISNEAKTHVDQDGLERHSELDWLSHNDCELKGFQGKHKLWSIENINFV